MINYILRRLLLLPITLFAIILVNFVIINLAPGDPVTLSQISSTGEASRSEDSGTTSKGEYYYLQFREHYGLTLPILFNLWPNLSEKEILKGLEQLSTQDTETISVEKHQKLRTLWGDRARFIMPQLLKIANDPRFPQTTRQTSANLFIRGGTFQGFVGPKISENEKLANKKIGNDNHFLSLQKIQDTDSEEAFNQKIAALNHWYQENALFYRFAPNFSQKVKIFFTETRFWRYMQKVLTLDFGTLRNDTNKTVISEVVKRFKYSLTLSLIPLIVTFVLCQFFGILMAVKHNRWPDISFNVLFLILYAIPIFVVAPFLIEKIALHHTIPFTNIPIPISGFSSPETVYEGLTSGQRLFDIIIHIFLPIVAIMYGTIAVQSRLSRTATLEVLRQDFVRTARAKGLPFFDILTKHVGRNASITIVTSLAASLGVVLGGSLIVETLFGINGFGRFFYEAIINRDYNVILFSAFAGSLLTLIGYLLADIAYTILDPRVSLE